MRAEFYGPILYGFHKGKIVESTAPQIDLPIRSIQPFGKPYTAENPAPMKVYSRVERYKWARGKRGGGLGWELIDDILDKVTLTKRSIGIPDSPHPEWRIMATLENGYERTFNVTHQEYTRMQVSGRLKADYKNHIKKLTIRYGVDYE